MTAAEFVGAMVFFLSPPLDFCDSCSRAYETETLLVGLSPKDSKKPTCKARFLSCFPWGTLAAVCFLLGGLCYMVAAVVDGFGILCDLDYISNVTETCYVVNDENATDHGLSTLSVETWPNWLNEMANTAAGQCHTL